MSHKLLSLPGWILINALCALARLRRPSAAFHVCKICVSAYLRLRLPLPEEWTYDGSAHLLRDRFKQKYTSARAIPLKFRTVAEVLNPQPEATIVIQKLLRWIELVDAASRCGGPKPPFCDEAGGAIFPEGVPWWLTDVSVRRTEEEKEKAADVDVEDGPPSEHENEGGHEESDDDPLTEAESDTPGSAINRRPVIAWT